MYESDWVNVYLDDVELPDGTHIDHHILTMPKASQTAIVLNGAGDQILLIWRHRFITDKWGWEVPAGWVEQSESPEDSIRREILEETGCTTDSLARLAEWDSIPGLSTMRFTAWLARSAGGCSGDVDSNEVSRTQWHSMDKIRELLSSGAVVDGPSLTSLSYFLATRETIR